MAVKGAADKRRDALRERHWSKEIPWKGAGKGSGETGWFSAPRTLPLILAMMRDKEINRRKGDPSGVYVELLARQRGQGVIEMEAPEVHAYACGYRSARGTRTWLELMGILEKAGFIRAKSGSGRRYDVVFIVHPAIVVEQLADAGRVREDLLNTYHKRQAEVGERTVEAIRGEGAAEQHGATVVPIKSPRQAKR